MKGKALLLLVLFLLLFLSGGAPVFAADLEKEAQDALCSSREVVVTLTAGLRGGAAVDAQMRRLRELAEEVRVTHLLLLERHRQRQEQAAALGSAAAERQQAAQAHYRAAVEHFLALVDALADPPDPAALQNLLTLLDRLLPEKRYPLLGTLPYRHLNLPPLFLPATTTVTPAYRGGDPAVTPADTAGPGDPEIVRLAESLGWSPVAIYEWVMNNVEAEWYRGSMKGAAETLRQKSGNDADQAALLAALLRASGFPTRYVRGVVEFFPDLEKAKSLTGLDDPLRIAAFFQKAGIPFEAVIAGGRIANFRIEHVWVETFVPYANYRGAVLDEHGKLWLPLDTHLKPSGNAWSAAAELPGGFALGQIRDDYLSAVRSETPLEYLRGRVDGYLQQNASPFAFADYLRRAGFEGLHLGILPGSLQFTTVAVTGEWAELPADLKHTVTFRAADPDNRELLTLTLDAARLSNRQLLLSFEPETVEDQRIIDAYGGLDSTPAYLVRLRPVLLLDGERLIVARDGLPMGAEFTLTVTLAHPSGAEQTASTHLAGNLAAIGIACQKAVLPPEALLEEKDAGRLLVEEALRYIERWNQSEEELASLLHLSLVRPLPTVVTVGGVLEVDYLLDIPHAVTWKGLFLDAGLRRVETVAAAGEESREREFMRLSALQGSALEGRLFEDDFGVAAVSTAKLLAIAQQDSTPLLTLDQSNVDALLPGLPLAENVQEDIANAVHQGYRVTIPEAEVGFRDWSGSGYRKENPQSGEAGYMLSGMIAGGMTADPASQWADQFLAATFAAPYSGKPNRQPLAAAAVRKIAAVDRQNGTVEAPLAQPLSVLVLDQDGTPVQGAAVTFRVLAGGGSFGEADIVTVVTDYQGIARASLTLGRRTADSPTYRKLGAADLNYTRVGLNLVTAMVPSAAGELSIEAPFEAYAAPGPPERIVHRLDAFGAAIPPAEVYGLPNTPVGTLLAQVVDRYGNPVSNVPITFAALPPQPYGATAPLPQGARNIEFYHDADCADPYPLYGQCATQDSASVVTAHYGAPIEAVFGNTVGTRYTVTASAAGLAPLSFTLKTTGYRTAGAYVAPGLYSRHLDLVGEAGEPLNAAPAGQELPVPLVDELFVLAEQFTMSGPYDCTKTNAQGESYQTTCWDMAPTGIIEATSVVNGLMDYTVTAGGGAVVATQNRHDGSYAATCRTGEEPAVNTIEARGRAVVSLPRVLYNLDNTLAVTGGYETPQLPLVDVELESGQTVRFDWRSGEPSITGGYATQYTVYGVQATVRIDPEVLILAEGGYAPQPVRFNYVIEPAAYQAAGVSVDLVQRLLSQPQQSPVFRAALVGPVNQGFGQAALAEGSTFALDQSHFARLILNRGTAVEIRSELLPLPTLVADLDIDSDNNAGYQADGTSRPPKRDLWEDQIEDQDGKPGKVLRPNLLDVDGDGVPGFADGIDLHGNQGENASAPFVPLVLELGGSALDPAQATIRFDYPGSDPANIQRQEADGKAVYTAAPGSLRLWTKDGKQSRQAADIGNGGDYVKPDQNYTLGQLGTKQTDGSWKLFMEGLATPEATSTQRIALVIDPDGDGPLAALDGDAVRATVLLASLVPDYDHNRTIDEADKERAARGDTYYFWINDDDDEGETEGSDIPGEKLSLLSSLDGENDHVDGVRDLIDFFPVVLDIRGLLEAFPPEQYAYHLKTLAENLNVLFSNLDQATIGDYLTDVDTARNIATFKTYPVPANGTFAGYRRTSLSEAQQQFNALLQHARETGTEGILLLEGSGKGQAPLILEIDDQTGEQVFTTSLHLSLDSVEQMFRHLNLIPAVASRDGENLQPEHGSKERGEPDRFLGPDEQPNNFPDSECGENYLVMLHGFKVDGQDARGWHSEMFKRLYWSGSNTRFLGVSWYGFENIPDYHQNVVNAFETAVVIGHRLKSVVGDRPVSLMAHSLGNMVISSYLEDYHEQLPPEQRPNIAKYFMFNAAVALEAYLGDYQEYAEGKGTELYNSDNPMVHPIWYGYQKRLGSSEWHQLFNATDDLRLRLTWRERFADINKKGVDIYSFYSRGEDVLGTHTGDPGLFEAVSNALLNEGRYSWVFQEKWKGRAPYDGYGGTTLMGWAFNSGYYVLSDKTEANSISGEQLKTIPFFRKPQTGELGGQLFENIVSAEYADQHRDELLAKALPSLTLPTGGLTGGDMTRDEFLDYVFDMNGEDFKDNLNWPEARGEDKNWKHSDLKKIAYPFNHKIFEKIIILEP